uniref:BTB domain-containing protein n=1 Tax=Caenorhabditis japonica TaxID=281687 RepID=A0A8R1I274_CAEJA
MEEDLSTHTSSSATSSASLTTSYDAVVHVKYTTENDQIETESVFAHRLVLSSFSPLLSQLLRDDATATSDDAPSAIELDLTAFANGVSAFKILLDALYTGEIKLKDCTSASEVLAVTRHCQVAGLDAKILSASTPLPLNLASLLNPHHNNNRFIQYQPPIQNYLSLITNIWANPLFSAFLSNTGATSTLPYLQQYDMENSRTQSEGSSPRANQTPPTTDLEKIVPNDDKEGWCRNKKYIEKVDGGFMCTVCRKIYGRYNSVSYHVTIYHRNPPIKCEENGCNFSTREARYIHFHKYYRHHIPLPENIDLGSRKCPFCRHVSKSPAMLEKHISRHETESSGNPGSLKRAQSK